MINKALHPISLIEKISSENKDYGFYLSKYVRGFRSTNTDRQVYPYRSLNFEEFEELNANLKPDEEISFNSNCLNYEWGEQRHVPLIDFQGKIDKYKVERLREFIPDEYADKLVLFDSGKSFHGYVPMLVNYYEWVHFMGSLLLLNFRDLPVSDARWVGHRLKEGFGALRLSANTDRYKTLPTLIGTLPELEKTYGL